MNKKRERTTTKFELGGGGVFFLIIFWGVRLNGVAFFRTGVTIVGLHFQMKALKVFMK